MDLKELLQFIDQKDGQLREKFGNYPDEEKRALGRFAKLAEEVGELSEQVTARFQRKEKDLSREKLEDEVADVLITTLLLAKCYDVDVVAALSRKVENLQKRQ